MLLIILSFLFQTLLLLLFKDIINNWELVSFFFIFVHFIFFMLSLGFFEKKMKIIFFFAYLIRLITMFWDLYAKSIYIIVGSGFDTEGFYSSAVKISQDISLINSNIYGGVYSKILGFFSYSVFPSRMILQYLNVVLGILILILIYKMLRVMKVNNKIINFSLLIPAFLPNAIINSAILKRENFIILFILISLYYFYKWFLTNKVKYIIVSLLFIIMASSFHSGVIGIIVGYAFAIIFYDHSSKRIKLKFKSFPIFVIVIIFFVILTALSSNTTTKFSNITSIKDVIDVADSGRGGSQYFKSIKINSVKNFILFSPIKMFYFLTSPLPTHWRGFGDILAFVTDGSVYLYFILNFFKLTKKRNIIDPFAVILIIMITTVTFMFGIGISNAGTAMRHRNKFLPIFVILNAYTLNKQKENNNNNNNNNKILN